MSEHELSDDELAEHAGDELPDRELMTLLPMNPLDADFVQLDPPVEQPEPGVDT